MSLPRKYNDEWIVENYSKYPCLKDLTKSYNEKFNDNLTKRVLASHCEKKLGLFKNRNFTAEQKQWIKEHYVKLGRKECARQFNERFNQNRSDETLKVVANRMGIKNTYEDWLKKHLVNIKKRKMPEGHEIVDSQGYILVKVNDKRKYITKQRYIYEKHNGIIPKGYSVIFLDGNKNNFDIENLIAVPNSYIRAVMCQRYSSFIRKDEPIDNNLKIKVNREIIKMYELEKLLKDIQSLDEADEERKQNL